LSAAVSSRRETLRRQPRRKHLLWATVLALGLAIPAVAPQGASAITVTVQPAFGGTFEVDLDDPLGVRNTVAITTVMPSPGSPDLVIGDVSAGIPDPIPSICQRVDPTIVRCPIGMITRVSSDLGPGRDSWGVGITQSIDASAIDLFQAYLGAGNDRATGGVVPNEIHGGPGRDEITGGPSRDYLYGNGRNDLLIGGPDLFRCGAGKRDRFDDGPGKDRVESTCELRVKSAQF
jgi:hypothetical protein